MAAEEFGNKINGKPIEILAGDHQNKPDVGASIANRWFDVDKVDADYRSRQLRGRLRGARHRQAEEQGSAADQRRLGRFHRQGLRAQQFGALGLRLLRDRRRDRRAVPQLGKNWYFFTADYTFGADVQGVRRRGRRRTAQPSSARCSAPTRRHRFLVLRSAGARPRRRTSSRSTTAATTPSTRSRRRNEFGIVAADRRSCRSALDLAARHQGAGLDIAQGMCT